MPLKKLGIKKPSIGPKGLYKPPGIPKRYSSSNSSSGSSLSYSPHKEHDFTPPEKTKCSSCGREIYETHILPYPGTCRFSFCDDCFEDVKESTKDKVEEVQKKYDNKEKNVLTSEKRLKQMLEEEIRKIVSFECFCHSVNRKKKIKDKKLKLYKP